MLGTETESFPTMQNTYGFEKYKEMFEKNHRFGSKLGEKNKISPVAYFKHKFVITINL